jgi:cysteine-rich repeat protein
MAGDGCSDTCTVEPGYTCTGGTPSTPDSCSNNCGDGIKVSVEICEDGNTDDGDGCDATCTAIEDDYDCTGGSLVEPDTSEVVCGNGIMFDSNDPTKYCDDNNTNSGDG